MFKISSLNFHAGTASDRFLGPYFLMPCLTGTVYRDFLRNVFPGLSQELDMQSRINLWVMHDGTLSHFLLAVRDFLKKSVPKPCIK